MNIFGIGLPEMAVIAAIALLVFGPKRLPELGKTLGRTLKGFQSASQGFEEQFRTALDAGSDSPGGSPSPADASLPAAPLPVTAGGSEASVSSPSSASSPAHDSQDAVVGGPSPS